jgi:hypothetical protein
MDPSPHVKELPGAVFGASGEQTWDISCDTGNGFLFVICLFVVFFFSIFFERVSGSPGWPGDSLCS